jgi:hypothetical protein
MTDRVRIVLPVDDEPPAPRPLARGRADLRGARVGVVDNGLWRSMVTVVEVLGQELEASHAAPLRTTPFDHLAPDFPRQQSALLPFADDVDLVVAGLGN